MVLMENGADVNIAWEEATPLIAFQRKFVIVRGKIIVSRKASSLVYQSQVSYRLIANGCRCVATFVYLFPS